MNHVVLLGDSIFDNARYVPGGSPIIEQLRAWLGKEWKATLIARDGACTDDILRQLSQIPDDVSHLIISVGGNDALEFSGLLSSGGSVQELLDRLTKVHEEFSDRYQSMLRDVLTLNLRTGVCTIYDRIPDLPKSNLTCLSIFNDVIFREGIRNRLPIVDLRVICDKSEDYSAVSSIEPSEKGGHKIVRALRRMLTGHDFHSRESAVYI